MTKLITVGYTVHQLKRKYGAKISSIQVNLSGTITVYFNNVQGALKC